MKNTKFKLIILGVGSRYQEGFSRIIDLLVEAEYVEIVCIVRNSKEFVTLGGKTYEPVGLSQLPLYFDQANIALNLLPSKIKSDVSIELLRAGINVLDETPISRRLKGARKLKASILDSSACYFLMENAYYYKSMFDLRELQDRYIGDFAAVHNLDIFRDYHIYSAIRVLKNIFPEVVVKSYRFDTLSRTHREALSRLVVEVSNGVYFDGIFIDKSGDRYMLGKAYDQYVEGLIYAFFNNDKLLALNVFKLLTSEQKATFLLTIKCLSKIQGSGYNKDFIDLDIEDFKLWRASRRNWLKRPFESIKMLMVDAIL